MGNTAQQGLFQDSDFAGDLEDSKSTWGEFCAYLEVTRLFPEVGCARSKLLSHTARRNLKLFLLMQVDAWMEFPFLILGIWLLKRYIILPSNLRNPKKKCRETCGMTHHQKHTNSQTKTQIQHNDLELSDVDYVSSNVKTSHSRALLHIFQDNEAVIKMIIKGRSPTMRRVPRTHRAALDWFFDRINLDRKIQMKYVDAKNPTRRRTDRRQFHTWWVEPSSPFVQYQHFQLFLLPSNDVEKDATRNKRIENCSKVEADVEPGFEDCCTVFNSAEFEWIERPGDTQSNQSARFESQSKRCRETCHWRFKSEWRSVEFSSVAIRRKNERQCEETRCCKNEPGSEFPRMCNENCHRKFRNHRRRRLGVAEQLPHISCLRSASRESLLESATATQSQARRQNGRPRCE